VYVLVPSQVTAGLTTGAEGVNTLPQLSITTGNVEGGLLAADGQDTVEPASTGSVNGSNSTV